ncbi:hypothetical protein TrRE_jg10052 [Triparma retinervis]|uniref:Kinesin-like protein n=1 Tax=Triparma retinervis TaxID=2557542 RepID=A0A9W6ZP08_9STRA|nr:hypothetical protein TrRE_jg10052 [Triparma retinervis]
MAGFNATLLTYGQTGAGKTYTTFGPPAGASAYKERGLAARAIAGAFEEINRYKTVNEGGGGTPIEVRLSCIEIYNESVFDLLGFSGEDDAKDSGRDGGVPSLSLFESPTAGVQIRGLKMPLVNSAEEGLNLLFESQMNRAIAEHQLNDASSRSHCIFTFHFTVRNPENNKVTSSKFNIVDLAGSEKMVKTEAVGKVQRESNYINKSLSFLEQVVIALASKSRDHVPYRQTKLTHVLKDSLGGNCTTLMIACIWPHLSHLDQSLSTLKFAARMQTVRNKPTVNESKTNNVASVKLLRQIKNLKEELAFHDIISGRSGILYEEPDGKEMTDIKDRTEQVMMSPTSDAYLQKKQMKEMEEMEEERRARSVPRASPAMVMIDNNNYSTGRTPPAKRGAGGDGGLAELRPYLGGKDVLEKQAEFDAFKRGAGKSQAILLGQAKLQIKTKKAEIKNLTNDINYQKDRIDFLMSQLRDSSFGAGASSPGSPTSPRAGEDPAKQLKLAKKAYRSKMETLTENKEELKFLQHQRAQSFNSLIAAFDSWLKMKGEEEVVEGVEERGGGEAAADLDYDREEANDWKRGEAGGENREYADEYYNESPRANPREAAAWGQPGTIPIELIRSTAVKCH